MTDAPTTYPDWKAPAQDGEVLVWPEPLDLIARTKENQSRLGSADRVLIQNAPLPELRRTMRQFLGHADERVPLVATGHQSELYHVGVWAKDVLSNRLASALGGQAFHFAVDTDNPKHLEVAWPGFSATLVDDPKLATRAWCALAAPPTPRHLQQIEEAARKQPIYHERSPLIQFLESMRRLALEPDELPAMLTNALHELDWSLGLRHHALTVSPALRSDGYLAFVHHVMSRPREFASQYNLALDEYRAAVWIRSKSRPMPDLFVSDEAIESPFWLDDLAAGTRSRPSAFKGGDGWLLKLVSGEEFTFDHKLGAFDAAAALRKFLSRTNHRLSPRALTLTIFLRLLVADQFVHGIGGGRYDQVADKIIASHFRQAPPTFSVTTATLFYPGAAERERVCLPCMLQQSHRLEHAVLGERKPQLLEQIQLEPRHSPRRQELFLDMQRQRRAALASSAEFSRWQQSLRDAEAQLQEEQVLFNRELFYAVQTRERLQMMITQYNTLF